MIADQTRTTKPALIASPFRVFGAIWACFWWSMKLHMAESHGLPRGSAGTPPVGWLAPDLRRRKIAVDAYGRWSFIPANDG